MTEFLKGYAAGANDMEAGRLVTKDLAVAAFKRGVQFRETTNAPVPSDEEICRKLSLIANGENDG